MSTNLPIFPHYTRILFTICSKKIYDVFSISIFAHYPFWCRRPCFLCFLFENTALSPRHCFALAKTKQGKRNLTLDSKSRAAFNLNASGQSSHRENVKEGAYSRLQNYSVRIQTQYHSRAPSVLVRSVINQHFYVPPVFQKVKKMGLFRTFNSRPCGNVTFRWEILAKLLFHSPTNVLPWDNYLT